jgi:hypothetical protein
MQPALASRRFLSHHSRFPDFNRRNRFGLTSAERITNRDRKSWDSGSSILIRQIVNPVEIELRLDEDIRFYVQLHARCGVYLKVIGAHQKLALVEQSASGLADIE